MDSTMDFVTELPEELLEELEACSCSCSGGAGGGGGFIN